VKSVLALLSLLALPVMAADPTLYGRYEYIKLPEFGGETLKAKMDTGALTASLSAKDIERFTRAWRPRSPTARSMNTNWRA
jgi:hypothetical protein